MTEEHIMFAGAGLQLEGVLHLPQGDAPLPGVVMCHPHPLYGGDMHNPVVISACRALATASIAALRFNFRGVGRSRGHYSDGIGEREDVKAALDFLSSQQKVDPAMIGLGGYSFGTSVAVPVALEDERVKAIALVSPFLPVSDWEQLEAYAKPKLVLAGSQDQVIPLEEVRRRVAELAEPKECEIIPGADHFWWGYDKEVGGRVSAFFSAALSS